MNTQRTLIILQYNIKNNKKDIMIFLLIDSIVR
jgi:glutathione synthase/RimK-type ligase-like ATP-grasp enzyme